MKLVVTILSFIMLTSVSHAQEQKQKPSLFDKWPELKQFHAVMSQTFHPSEEGNLEPIKTRSGEMKEKAATLAASTIPAEVNNDKVKSALAKLKENTVVLDKMIADKKTDKEITEYLSTVHDTFHEIVGLCREEH
jgi:hypothetical protein